ncbi:MAG: rhomboid family intramembrane serine protease [Anaerolineae bacterium]|nr:rhomboid family intramembrane serine protease [Anaerolineae bacterium]
MLIFFIFLITILLTLIQGAIIFPLPITDTGNVRYRSIPVMTLTLILINSLIFLFFQAPHFYQGLNMAESGDMEGLNRLYQYVTDIWTYGYRGVFMREGVSIGAFSTFTSMFMHGDMWHLLGNMIFLWAFGRRVEDACGAWRFLLFYLVAGMVANVGSEVLNPSMADLPGIGASGAISGVMGAYLVLFPGAMVTCFWGIGIVLRFPVVVIMKMIGMEQVEKAPNWRWTIQLPGWLLLIYFLIKDTIPSLTVIQQGQDYGGVNNLAHLTGFLAALFIFLYVRKDLLTRYIQGRRL